MTGAPFADIAAALKTQANMLAERATNVERVATTIGLSPGAVGRVIFDTRKQADMIAEAHRIITALTPVESTVRAVMGEAA